LKDLQSYTLFLDPRLPFGLPLPIRFSLTLPWLIFITKAGVSFTRDSPLQ
jgi:hypothetical protein